MNSRGRQYLSLLTTDATTHILGNLMLETFS